MGRKPLLKRLSDVAPLPFERAVRTSLLATTLASVSAVSLVLAVLVVWVTLSLTQQRAEHQATERLHALIDATGIMASASAFAHDATLARETAQAFVKNTDVLAISIMADGKELARATRANARRVASITGNDLPLKRAIFSPFDATETIGELIVTPNWEEINRTVDEEVRYVAVLVLLAICLVIGLIALTVSVRVIRPVKLISDGLHHMDTSSKTLAIPPGHRDNELGRLVEDINDLFARLRLSLQLEHESRLQRVVTERLQLAAEVFDNSQEGIMVTDHENLIVAVNPAFTAITGYSDLDVLGKNPKILSSGKQGSDFYASLWRQLHADGFWKGELWNRRKDGEIIPKWFSINVVKDSYGKTVNHVAIFSDISERKRSEAKIDFLAHHDALTKLPNRVLLRDRFLQAQIVAMRNQSGIALMFMDLDNFKYINDNYGHHAGDQTLISVVQQLSLQIRNSDTVCRQGGDEFIVILPELNDLEIISRIAQNILQSLAQPIALTDKSVNISASIGIAIYPNDGDDFETLLRHADAAMYDAKMSGKNAFRFYTEDMNQAAQDKMKLRASLHNALMLNEFEIYYQPQINLCNGYITGVEALIRWNHPDFGMISPDRFIPLAEECGLIIPIGEWVLKTACKQGHSWRAEGHDNLSMAVNISALQLNRGILLGLVKTALHESNLAPQALELELTESTLLYDVPGALTTITELKGMGIRFAIDDFGTGYSSLAYLKQIKVDKLKIDKSFIQELGANADDLAIVQAIIQLGKTLQLRIIAEGVETPEQLSILKAYGCDDAQGYLCGRPQSAQAMGEMLTNARMSKVN
jgi:diguanylate cyclase (GGDEF)-like protein/PAS domain S-box-containing protein